MSELIRFPTNWMSSGELTGYFTYSLDIGTFLSKKKEKGIASD